jgi:hypothetical protein
MALLTPQEMFSRVCQAIVPGNAWPSAIADLWGVRLDTVRHWKNGRSPLRQDHFETLLGLIARRREELARAEQELREWLEQQSPEDNTP